jgi:hypothetical protein
MVGTGAGKNARRPKGACATGSQVGCAESDPCATFRRRGKARWVGTTRYPHI